MLTRILLLLLCAAGGLVFADEVVFEAARFTLAPGAELTTGDGGRTVARIRVTGRDGWLASGESELPPGRWRAWFRLAASPFAHRSGTVYASIDVGDARYRVGLNGADFPGDGSYVEFPLDISVLPGTRPWFLLGWGEEDSTEVLYASLVRFVRLDTGVGVVAVRPEKVLYEPGETGRLRAALVNYGSAALTLSVRAELVQELSLATPVAPVSVTLRPGQASTIELPFVAPRREYGCEARVAVLAGGAVLDRNSDVFNVSSNVWKVMLGATPSFCWNTGRLSPEEISQGVETCRQEYGNLVEKSFWPPDDWGLMAPREEEWMGGQAGGRYEKKARMQQFIREAHVQGIKVVTYAKHYGDGTAGWELYRARPDWFHTEDYYYGVRGVPTGAASTWDLRHWDDIPFHLARWEEFEAVRTGWSAAPTPDHRRIDVLDWGIVNLIASTDMFGWDGARFDGHWTAGNDELSTWNARTMKERVWARYPKFVFGFNCGYSFGEPTGFAEDGARTNGPHERRENMAGGGLWMQEAVRGWERGPGVPFRRWSELLFGERKRSDQLHRIGGNYGWILDLQGAARDMRYKLAIATAVGAHPYYGGHSWVRPRGWGRFLTRWSAMVYDPELRGCGRSDPATVESGRPLWWNGLARERIADSGRRQLVVHILNPPRRNAIDLQAVDPMPDPVRDVVVRAFIPRGQAVTGVMLLDPDAEPDAVPLSWTVANGQARVRVPRVTLWSMVVFEFSGTFRPPAPRDRFSERPDPVQVEAGRRPGTSTPSARPFWRWSNGVRWVDDADAQSPNHVVTRSDDSTAGFPNAHEVRWVIPPSAGRYRATFRVKVDRARPEASVQFWARFSDDQRSHTYFDEARSTSTFRTPGRYEEVSLELEYMEEGHISFGVWMDNPSGGNGLTCDVLRLDLIERYDDERLARRFPELHAPDGWRIGGAAGLDVLWVHGMLDGFYRIREALRMIPGARVAEKDENSSGTALPILDWDTLGRVDVLILADCFCPVRYRERRAIADFVERGGGLIVLGGPYSLGQGAYDGTAVEALLPVDVGPGRDLLTLPLPAPLIGLATSPLLDGIDPGAWQTPGMLYRRHSVDLRNDAEVCLVAESDPVIVASRRGAGRTLVFMGTMLGGPAADNGRRGVEIPGGNTDGLPFWDWPAWPTLMRNAIRWSARME